MEPATSTSTSPPARRAPAPPLVVEARRGPQRPFVPPTGGASTPPARAIPNLSRRFSGSRDNGSTAESRPAHSPGSAADRAHRAEPSGRSAILCRSLAKGSHCTRESGFGRDQAGSARFRAAGKNCCFLPATLTMTRSSGRNVTSCRSVDHPSVARSPSSLSCSEQEEFADLIEHRHSFRNLVLMCGVHSDVIDDPAQQFTVRQVLQIKRDHELAMDIVRRWTAAIRLGLPRHRPTRRAPQFSSSATPPSGRDPRQKRLRERIQALLLGFRSNLAIP